MITAQMAKELVENYPNMVFQRELESLSENIQERAKTGNNEYSSDLSALKNMDKIVEVLTKSGFTIKLADRSNVKESAFSFNKKEILLDIISW